MIENNINIEFPIIDMRPYQEDIWDRFINNDIYLTILIWHRRGGKDIFSFNSLVEKALEKKGLYWYIFPLAVQARKSFWEAFIQVQGAQIRYIDLIPQELIKKKSDAEMKIELINGSIIRCLGADNPDNLRGANPYGVVVSEYAQHRPTLWGSILEPILKANKGWCIFNSTPLGENHCYEMYNFLKEKQKEDETHYIASLLTINDTKILNENDIDDIRRQGRPEELIQQEYYCSFAGALTGSYYASILSKIEENNFLDNINYDGESGVNTAWDLGVSDATAIWFFIIKNQKVELIDYYENTGYGLSHYVRIIEQKPYKYINHYLPHDGAHRTLTQDERCKTIQHQLTELGLQNVKVIERTKDLYGDIQAVRNLLNICYFDKTKCKDGLMSLKNYRREYDENRKCYKQTPLHDWTSHGSDAFRIIPIVYNEKIRSKTIINKQPIIWNKKF